MGTDYAGTTVWITGASSGIGAALARRLGAKGANLILSGRNEEALTEVARAAGGQTLIAPFEAIDLAAIPAIAARALAWQGRLDMLINNAGISQRSLAVDTDMAVYRRIVDVDLIAPIALTQAVLPRMIARGSGRIVMIASVAGKVGVPLRTAYCAAKHGLIGYADALRAEVASAGLTVHTVAPGSVATRVAVNALDGSGTARGVSDPAIDNGLDPDKVAKKLLKAVAAGKREIVIAAKGIERDLPRLRARAPDAAFDTVERLMAEGYAAAMHPSRYGGDQGD